MVATRDSKWEWMGLLVKIPLFKTRKLGLRMAQWVKEVLALQA